MADRMNRRSPETPTSALAWTSPRTSHTERGTPLFVTRTQVVEHLGVSRQTLSKYVGQGLTTYRQSLVSQQIFDTEEVLRFKAEAATRGRRGRLPGAKGKAKG